jgi:glyoxylase-like metal-dependent hydrolase (beta-lactamase superfamily II)
MQVILFKSHPDIYTCNVYFLAGEYRNQASITTLVDAGSRDEKFLEYLIDEIERQPKGIGHKHLDQIILTHEHFDHTGGLKALTQRFKPRVYAVKPGDYVTDLIHDGQVLPMGDCDGHMLHTPGHSEDSLCIYVPKHGALFSGDTELNIRLPGGHFSHEYISSVERLSVLEVKTIYSGHNPPVTNNPQEEIRHTLLNMRKSRLLS